MLDIQEQMLQEKSSAAYSSLEGVVLTGASRLAR